MNIGRLSKTFPLEPLRNIFKVSSLNIVKDTSDAPEETKFDKFPIYYIQSNEI